MIKLDSEYLKYLLIIYQKFKVNQFIKDSLSKYLNQTQTKFMLNQSDLTVGPCRILNEWEGVFWVISVHTRRGHRWIIVKAKKKGCGICRVV